MFLNRDQKYIENLITLLVANQVKLSNKILFMSFGKSIYSCYHHWKVIGGSYILDLNSILNLTLYLRPGSESTERQTSLLINNIDNFLNVKLRNEYQQDACFPVDFLSFISSWIISLANCIEKSSTKYHHYRFYNLSNSSSDRIVGVLGMTIYYCDWGQCK